MTFKASFCTVRMRKTGRHLTPNCNDTQNIDNMATFPSADKAKKFLESCGLIDHSEMYVCKFTMEEVITTTELAPHVNAYDEGRVAGYNRNEYKNTYDINCDAHKEYHRGYTAGMWGGFGRKV